MQPEEVKQLLNAALEDCDIDVEVQGSHFNLTIVGDVFDGLRPLKRQQMVYSVLNSKIADGTIHAVNMKISSRAELAQ